MNFLKTFYTVEDLRTDVGVSTITDAQGEKLINLVYKYLIANGSPLSVDQNRQYQRYVTQDVLIDEHSSYEMYECGYKQGKNLIYLDFYISSVVSIHDSENRDVQYKHNKATHTLDVRSNDRQLLLTYTSYFTDDMKSSLSELMQYVYNEYNDAIQSSSWSNSSSNIKKISNDDQVVEYYDSNNNSRDTLYEIFAQDIALDMLISPLISNNNITIV